MRYAKDGDPTLLVWRIPSNFTSDEFNEVQCFVIPMMSRPGGALYAIPDKVIPSDTLLTEMMREEPELIGPSREFACQLYGEDDQGAVVDSEFIAQVHVVDLRDEVLEQMREYDLVTDSSEDIAVFSDQEPNSLPKVATIMHFVYEWVEAVALERLNFYSAREEQAGTPKAKAAVKKHGVAKKARPTIAMLMEQMNVMQAQLQTVLAKPPGHGHQALDGGAGPAAEPQGGAMIAKIPALTGSVLDGMLPAKAAALIGPPPRAKQVPAELVAPGAEGSAVPIQGQQFAGSNGEMLAALSQQSLALTQLVAHLAGGDALTDLASSSTSTGLSLSSKGVARREKMQQDLANKTSCYFMQMQQQLFKSMNPSKPLPKTQEELLSAQTTMASYLERHGGYRHSKDNGLAMWIVAHAVDSAAAGDFDLTKEYLALLAVSLEQATMDGGWSLAFILSLVSDPPQNLFAERMQPLTATGRPFSPLVPSQWAAVALSYIKELDVLNTRKSEVKKPATPKLPAPGDPSGPPSPKRKPKFPKKPKAGGETSA